MYLSRVLVLLALLGLVGCGSAMGTSSPSAESGSTVVGDGDVRTVSLKLPGMT